MSAISARPPSRSSLSMTASARWRSDSTVASRARPTISRSITTSSASPASSASANPIAPSQGARAYRSSTRFVTANPSASSTSPDSADQNSAPQGMRRFGAAATARTGSRRGASAMAATLGRCALIRLGNDQPRIVHAEDRGLAQGFIHRNRSPIRNCSARSRRMWGSAGMPSSVCSSAAAAGSRIERKVAAARTVLLGRQIAGKERHLGRAVEMLGRRAIRRAPRRPRSTAGRRPRRGPALRGWRGRRRARSHRPRRRRSPARAMARSVICLRIASSRSWAEWCN